MRKVDIFLSSPIRSSTLTRDGNIVGVDIGIYEVFKVVSSDDDSYRISIPSLAVNEAIHLTVITRETQIESNEVLFAFESVIKVNSNKLLLFSLLAFVFLLLLVWLLSSRGSLRERRARHRPLMRL